MTKEKAIANETHRLLKEKLETCFREEGVNFFINCKDIREKYLKVQQDFHKGMVLPADENRQAAPKPKPQEFGDDARARFNIK